MPSKNAIRSYWATCTDWGLGQTEPPHGQIDFRGDNSCFACGWGMGSIRAHILAKCDGGSDDVSNLHILCRFCHTDSEYLTGDDYWRWFWNVDYWDVGYQMLRAHGIDLAKLHSIPPDRFESFSPVITLCMEGSITNQELLDRLEELGCDIRLRP